MKKKLKNYGLVISKEKDPQAYILGGFASLPKIILQPDGQWDVFLPEREVQNEGFERFNCTAYNTNSCLEILFNRLNEKIGDRSDRFLGIKAETKPPGNDPHKVAQAAHTYGLIAEASLPNNEVDNVGDYYTFKGKDALVCDFEAQDFLKKWEVGHEYVFQGKTAKEKRIALIKEALQYSPLGVAVSAWTEQDGVYIDNGKTNNHWTCAYGYTEKGIKIFDSYDNTLKLLSWDHNISICKRYHLEKQATKEEIGLFFKMLQAINSWLNLWEEQEVVAPIVTQPIIEPHGSYLIKWATAIRDYEGKPGDLSYKNNNPGNLRSAKGPFLKFKTWEEGWSALLDYLTRAATGKHKAYKAEFSLSQFFKVYAPAADKNNPIAYARFVANRIGVDVSEQIKNLI